MRPIGQNWLECSASFCPSVDRKPYAFPPAIKIFDFAGSSFSVQAAYGQAWALTHFLTEEHLPELIKFYRAMAVDDFQTKRDEVWRRKIMDTFQDCFGDVDALETEWRSYMRKLKTDLEILQERI